MVRTFETLLLLGNAGELLSNRERVWKNILQEGIIDDVSHKLCISSKEIQCQCECSHACPMADMRAPETLQHEMSNITGSTQCCCFAGQRVHHVLG